MVLAGDYGPSGFDTCQGDVIAPPGVYDGSTFHQGDPQTPAAHEPGQSSNCQAVPTIVGQLAVASGSIVPSSLVSANLSASASASGMNSSLIPAPTASSRLSSHSSSLVTPTPIPSATASRAAASVSASSQPSSSGTSRSNVKCLLFGASLLLTAVLAF